MPVKAALAMMGLMEDTVRQPLLPLEDAVRSRVEAVLRSAGVMTGEPVSQEVAA